MLEDKFRKLRSQGGTFRSIVQSGTGRNKVYGSRVGVDTESGDLEKSDWQARITDLIHEAGEDQLFSQLLTHTKETDVTGASASELKHKALELHSNRIFDNQEWVDFIPFNEKYRPEVLDDVPVVEISLICCKQPGLITQKRYERDAGTLGVGLVHCPICGRWSVPISVGEVKWYADQKLYDEDLSEENCE